MLRLNFNLCILILFFTGILLLYILEQYLKSHYSNNEDKIKYIRKLKFFEELSDENNNNWQELKIKFPLNENNEMEDFKIYLFSAYFDTRIGDNKKEMGIKIISLIPFKLNQRIQIGCNIFTTNEVYPGKINILIHKEHHEKKFAPCTLSCSQIDEKYINENISKVIVYIFDKENVNIYSEKILKVNYIPKNFSETKNISICVRPWWGEPIIKNGESNPKIFNNAGLLLEFFNAYRKLGVEKIFIYENYLQVDENVEKIINYYSKTKNFVEVIPYKLPLLPYKEVWDFAQVSMIQDCLLRNVKKSKYLLFVDTDEFVLPTTSKYDLTKYFKLMEENKKYENVGAIWIPMFFHFLEWKSDFSNIEKYSSLENSIKQLMDLDFVLYYKTCRMLNPGTKKGEKGRRKVIVKPERVIYMGIHEPETMVNDYKFIKAPAIKDRDNYVSLYLHHYRKATGIVSNDPNQLEFKKMLMENNCLFNSENKNNLVGNVFVDNIVRELLGTELYKEILQDINIIQNRINFVS